MDLPISFPPAFSLISIDLNIDLFFLNILSIPEMLADIKRRMKNWNLWSRSPEEPGGGHPRWRLRPGTADPTSQPPRENSAPASQPPRENSAPASQPPPRRSTRELTPRNEPTNELEPRDGDIILSLRDGLYKDVMYKHYKILGKRDPGDKGREAEMGSQIFRSLRSSLGREGRFFKRMSRGDYPYLIDDDGALESKYFSHFVEIIHHHHVLNTASLLIDHRNRSRSHETK